MLLLAEGTKVDTSEKHPSHSKKKEENRKHKQRAGPVQVKKRNNHREGLSGMSLYIVLFFFRKLLHTLPLTSALIGNPRFLPG